MIARIFNQKYKLVVLSSAFLLGIFIYSNTLYSSFHLDDIVSVVDNPAIRNILNLQAIWNFWPTRFITYFSVALNYHISQLNVFSYHFFNLVVHLSSGILVWWFMLLTFSTPAMKGQKIAEHAKLIAFFAGLIFITHPIQTQGVTYIIQRAASLATLFYLASLSLYVKSRLLQQQGESLVVSRLFYYGSLIAAVMAMFTKEMTITLPFMVLFYESCFLKTKEKLNWKYLVPFLATLLIIPLTMFLTKSVDFVGMRRVLKAPSNISSWQYLLTQLRVMVTYLRLLFIPINQNLDYYYPIAKNLIKLPILASLIFLVSILIIAMRIFSKYRLISFSIFWFFLTLLPESSVIPIYDVIFEHRLYLPMVGFSFFLASFIYYLFENKSSKSMVILLLIIISCYAILTYRRNFIWKDELTLWNDVVHKSPKKARPYFNRGNAYIDQGSIQQAISDFNKAIEINPSYVKAYNNRGNVYADQSNFTQAISDYTKSIELNSNLAEPYNNRGTAYYAIKEYGKAWADVYKAEGLGCVVNPEFLATLKKVSGRNKQVYSLPKVKEQFE
ncbi:MAG: tetratricopeptide repeat protein [Candidatus Omnitrophota bacterium]|nr:tetratricopeptide repeat protein [Candidatus Omnitrophota bacterium]